VAAKQEEAALAELPSPCLNENRCEHSAMAWSRVLSTYTAKASKERRAGRGALDFIGVDADDLGCMQTSLTPAQFSLAARAPIGSLRYTDYSSIAASPPARLRMIVDQLIRLRTVEGI